MITFTNTMQNIHPRLFDNTNMNNSSCKEVVSSHRKNINYKRFFKQKQRNGNYKDVNSNIIISEQIKMKPFKKSTIEKIDIDSCVKFNINFIDIKRCVRVVVSLNEDKINKYI